MGSLIAAQLGIGLLLVPPGKVAMAAVSAAAPWLVEQGVISVLDSPVTLKVSHLSFLSPGILPLIQIGEPCGGDSVDRDYLKSFCRAGRIYTEDIDKVFDLIIDGEIANPDDLREDIATIMEDFVDEYKDARPPQDLRMFHDESTRQLKQGAEFLRRNDLEKLVELYRSLPDAPRHVQVRLENIAQDVNECKKAQERGFDVGAVGSLSQYRFLAELFED